MKPETHTFDIDGLSVVLTRVPIRRYDWDHRGKHERGHPDYGHPKEQCLYEITIGGELVGRASRPYGFGKQAFGIERLGPEVNWKLGEKLVWGRGYHPRNERLYELSEVAAKAAKLRGDVLWGEVRRLATREEQKGYLIAAAAREAQQEAENRARSEAYAAQRAEEARQKEEHRVEVLEGLKAILASNRVTMTNFEVNALMAAIERYENDRPRGAPA